MSSSELVEVVKAAEASIQAAKEQMKEIEEMRLRGDLPPKRPDLRLVPDPE